MASRFLNSLLFGAAALGAGSGPVQAQANPLLGSWAINFAAGTRIENGTPTTITGTGKLVVQLQGDSIIARLIPDPMDGATRPETRARSCPSRHNPWYLRLQRMPGWRN